MKKIYSLKVAAGIAGLAMIASCGASSDSKVASAATTATLSLKGSSSLSLTGGNTSKANMTVYEFLVSKNEDCSSPVSVFKSAEGKTVDMMTSPAIGEGELELGTYPCVIMVISDNIKFVPASTSGVCTAGEEYSLDVFRPQGETYQPTGTLPDGTAISGKVEEQKIAVYISTLSTSTGGGEGSNPLDMPSSSAKTNGIKLLAPLVVEADAVGTLVLDTTGTVESNDGTCDMQPPAFGFK